MNAHDLEGFTSLLTDDVVVNSPDGLMHNGKDSARAWMAGHLSGFHVDSYGWDQTGDTLKWMSAVYSDAFARMSMNPMKLNTMGVLTQGTLSATLRRRPEVNLHRGLILKPMLVQVGFSMRFPSFYPTQVPSIAILYLKNLGAEKDEPYCYGITQDLIIDMAKAGGIRVATMQDVLSVQGAGLSIAGIAQKLQVRYVVEGSLKREGGLFQLRAQVVEAATGSALWADRLQVHETEAASLQGRFATAIVNALGLEPSPAAVKALGRSRSTNPEAYEYYLRAKYVYEKRKTKNETGLARGLFEKAIALDSGFVSAWIALGLSYEHAAEYPRAKNYYAGALERAEATGDRSGEGFALEALGEYYFNSGDHMRAAELLDRADSLYAASDERQNVLRTSSMQALNEASAGNRSRSEGLMGRTVALLDSIEQNADLALIYWRLSQVCRLLDQPAGQAPYLDKAYKILTGRAEKIIDPAMRVSYLRTVKANREIVQAWKDEQTLPEGP